MIYPVIYIDDAYPEGWGLDYSVKEINSISVMRDFSSTYYNVKSILRFGLDLRGVQVEQMSSLLKLMEESNLELIIRVREPVPLVILSRSGTVIKKSRIESKSVVQSLVREETVIAEKIRNLRS